MQRERSADTEFYLCSDGQGKPLEFYWFSNPPEQQPFMNAIRAYSNSGTAALKAVLLAANT